MSEMSNDFPTNVFVAPHSPTPPAPVEAADLASFGVVFELQLEPLVL